jgi:DNA-binding helix-hairpin-helix protein with protein kinase domain
MNLEIFQPGEHVRTLSTGLDCEVRDLLGGGGQGEVYRASLGGRDVALKWYYPAEATPRQRALIENLIRKGPPTARFLWPIELAESKGKPGFGYVMLLREPRFRGLVDLMKRRIDPSFRVLATAGFELADSFLQLHSKGLCYRDISFGNLFLDPGSGEIRICDNDNVAVDGDASAGVLGTPRFMAPEVVRGDAQPGTQTDLFSLAVLLFYLFMVHHPLEGKKELAIHSFDLPAMTKLYGIEPVFIFDPSDRSNEPVPGHHDNALVTWPIYPQFLRDLFVKAFTSGITDAAHGRVREGEWRAAMVRLRDSIVYCAHCSAENFYDRSSLPASSDEAGICWACQRRYRLPFRIRIGRNVIVLNHDARLFPHHIDDRRPYDFSAAVAEISRHPMQPGVWGLKNLSAETWFVQSAADPAPREVPPGRSAGLAPGARINFGPSVGEVRG